MKLKIDRKVFAQALAEVAPFAPSKAPIAILKNAKITTKGNRMKIEANDTQCSMVKYIEVVECDEDGSFLIDIADFNKFVAKIKGDIIEIEVDGNTIKVIHSKGSAEFATENPEEFPVFKMPQTEVSEITILADLISEAVRNGRNFVANEPIRPQLCPIYAYTEGNVFGFCATDTHKMIHGTYAHNEPFSEDINFFIMPSVFSALVNACKNADAVKIHITKAHVQYTVGNVRIQTVQAKGNYPNFKRVIPATWNMECAVDKTEVMDALSRLQLFCDASECIKMDVSRLDMTLSVDNLDFMKSSKENITHNGCDGEIKIGVNVGYMQDCVGVFGQGEILLRMTDPARPILFAQKDTPYLQVITMPLQIINGE